VVPKTARAVGRTLWTIESAHSLDALEVIRRGLVVQIAGLIEAEGLCYARARQRARSTPFRGWFRRGDCGGLNVPEPAPKPLRPMHSWRGAWASSRRRPTPRKWWTRSLGEYTPFRGERGEKERREGP